MSRDDANTSWRFGDSHQPPRASSMRSLVRLRDLHPHRLALEGLVAAMTPLVVGTVALAGHLSIILLVFLVITTLGVLTTASDLFIAAAFVTCSVLLWLASGAPATSWWSLPLALELLVSHTARTLIALGPPQAPIPRAVALAWLRRLLTVAAATAAMAAVGITLAGGQRSGSGYAAAGLLVLLAIGVGLLPRLFPRERQ